jgi:hypothetical protein
MRWLFLSPSLDFQRDGVADYSARLVEALQKQGVQGRTYGFKNQPDCPTFVRQLKEFSPDVVSWQYVPYDYLPKAFPFKCEPGPRFCGNFHSSGI